MHEWKAALGLCRLYGLSLAQHMHAWRRGSSAVPPPAAVAVGARGGDAGPELLLLLAL